MTEAAPEPTKTAPREYVILQKASGDYWSNVGKVTASSVENAIKKHIAAIDLSSDDQVDGPDPFIAVPARYWKPVTAKIEVKSTVTLS
jgi:hypothetical protein